MLVEDLQNYHRQFLSIKSEAQNLLDDLTDLQFNWRPSPNRWSIALCIDHLLVTGRNSLSHIHETTHEARSKGLFSGGPFRYGIIERWFVRQMEPQGRMKFKAPKPYMPTADWFDVEIATSFYALQEEFLQCIEEANGIDLSRVKVKNDVRKLVGPLEPRSVRLCTSWPMPVA
jgi:hypothetical protein